MAADSNIGKQAGLSTDRSSIRSLLRGSAVGGAIYIAAALINVALQFVLTWQLGQSGYGIFVFVYSLVLLFAVPATLGAQMALLRFVPAYLSTADWPSLNGVIRAGLAAPAIAGLVLALIGIGAVRLLSGELQPELVTTYYAGFALLPLLAVVRSAVSVVRGLERLVPALMANMLLLDLTIICGVFVTIFVFNGRVTPDLAMRFAVTGALLALALLAWSGFRSLPAGGRNVRPSLHLEYWWKTAWPLLIVAVARTSFDRIGILMVGALVDTDQAALYALAARLADIVVFPLVALNAYFATRIAQLHARGDGSRLQHEVQVAGLWTFAAATLVALPLLILPTQFLSLFGPEFTGAADILRILVAGQWLIVAAGSVGFLLSMTDQERIAAVTVVLAAIFNVMLGLFLIPQFGAVGGAVSFALASGGMSIYMALAVYRRLDIIPGILASFVPALSRRRQS